MQAAENRRYVEGQKLYLQVCKPQRRATIVIDNEDLGAPAILRWQTSPQEEQSP